MMFMAGPKYETGYYCVDETNGIASAGGYAKHGGGKRQSGIKWSSSMVCLIVRSQINFSQNAHFDRFFLLYKLVVFLQTPPWSCGYVPALQIVHISKGSELLIL